MNSALVSAGWLRERLADPTVRVVHVSLDRRHYEREHVPGAVFGALHGELGEAGTAPETGDAPREALLPAQPAVEATLARWGVGEGDRIVFYDDVGLNRHAVRGYWLLRVYRFPADRLHVLDGGLEAWKRAGHEVLSESAVGRRPPAPVRLGPPDASLVAGFEEVRAWSAEAVGGGPARLLDLRTDAEFRGDDARARRGGHVPGARHRAFEDFIAPDGTFRPVAEMLEILRASGIEPSEIRATYCQTGARSALGWFVLNELAGYREVRNYAGSWEEWGNRDDGPVER